LGSPRDVLFLRNGSSSPRQCCLAMSVRYPMLYGASISSLEPKRPAIFGDLRGKNDVPFGLRSLIETTT
jgi:hypothetical protein